MFISNYNTARAVQYILKSLFFFLVVHTDEMSYECKFCGKLYKRSRALQCHLSVHTGERPYSCPWCDRTFINGSNCRKHKLNSHPKELAAFEAKHGKRRVKNIQVQDDDDDSSSSQ